MALHTHNDIHLSLYHNTLLTQNANNRALNKKVHLRVHHPNALFSFGYQDHNIFVNKLPPVVSAWALGGVQKDDISVFGGLHSGFDLVQHLVPFGGLLVGLKHKKFTIINYVIVLKYFLLFFCVFINKKLIIK